MDSANFNFDEIINDENLTIIDFSATWCMHCRTLTPILERISDKLDDVNFFQVDIDENEEVAKRYRIFSVPTLVAFREGKMIDSLVGICPTDEIMDFVNKCKSVDISNL